MLKKSKGISKDSKGMVFNYYRYYNLSRTGKISDIFYTDAHGFGIKSDTLKQLKMKMGKL